MLRHVVFAFALIAVQPVSAQTAPEHAQLADPDGLPIVVGSSHRIRSSVYGSEQILTVRLPRGYADHPDKSYPVLFSVDGGPEQDFELLAGIAAEAEFSTSFEPFILIGVKTEDRYSQLTPAMKRLPPERLKENFGDRIKPGGADRFRDYLTRDVVPWATGRYRTDRKILTAASLGGLFVLDTFLERPEMFDDYIALTPSLWWDDGRIVAEAPRALARHGPSDRRIYFTMGDEGVGNRTASWLAALVKAFETNAPEGLKWAFVDRSGSEEHRTMALTGWLDAMRTLYLTPARSGSPLTLLYDGFRKPEYTPEAQKNVDAGPCTRAIAEPVTFKEKNRRANELYGMCLLMKPGSEITAGNLKPGDFGRRQ
ncbi:alpha/beta hydrolase [Sphingosinicella sp. LY1275]|uniref:alpha/beta hydrolase n=1 Tax=Sphingosinicella sp. LY1275 TaxID=3095379 RepID=UPI002ADEE28A|nr:alpha/beta hydrolase-fold protein [Sphingosinicella sp. LY1275]MEA1015057.1 alpha/beta hydrolase-fold protein [Sphingosinicella sp. LY1275]